jgi:hypothetical protein
MPVEYGMHSSSDVYVDSGRRYGADRSRPLWRRCPPPSEAADARLRCGVERRQRADGRGQRSPGSRRPAAVQDGSIGQDLGETARRRRRGKRPWRPDPEQDLLGVEHPTRLRKEIDAVGTTTRDAVQEWTGRTVPSYCLTRHGVERRLLLNGRGGIRERERLLNRRVHRSWKGHRRRRRARQRPLHGALRGAGRGRGRRHPGRAECANATPDRFASGDVQCVRIHRCGRASARCPLSSEARDARDARDTNEEAFVCDFT